MEFGDVLFGFILFVLCPLAVFIGIAQIKKAKVSIGERGGEMRASELRRMVEDAVEMVTAPLKARITDLEERLGDEPVYAVRERLAGERLEERLAGPALSAAFDPEADLDDADGRPVQRRARA